MTALAGKHKPRNQQNNLLRGNSDGKQMRSPRAMKQKKKSKSPSPPSNPKNYNAPHLFTKRTFGNKYCGYCIKDELEHHRPHNDSKISDGRSNPERSLERHLKTKFTPGRIRASQKIDKNKTKTQTEQHSRKPSKEPKNKHHHQIDGVVSNFPPEDR